jgi:hypothetical protein
LWEQLRNERTTARAFYPRVDLLRPNGEHLRRITPGVAELLVAEGRAEISAGNGRIRSVKLVETAQTHATRLGEPTAPSVASYGTRFIVREKLDSGATTWRFHSRSFDA